MTYAATRGQVGIQSYTRPLRFAIVLHSPVSTQAFRRAIGQLCEFWGGTKSVIVAGSPSASILEEWRPAIVALDPDIVLLGRGMTSKAARRSMLRTLDDLGIAPFAVEDQVDADPFGRGWQAMPVPPPAAADERRFPLSAPLLATTPAHSAILGNPERANVAGTRRANASTLPLSTLPAGTPVHRAALNVPGFATASSMASPFLYHRREDVDIGMAVWNYRANRGPLLHGGDERLARHLALVGRTNIRTYIVELDPISASAQKAVQSVEEQVTVVKRSNFVFDPGRRRLPIGFDLELDTADMTDGAFELPRKAPCRAVSTHPAWWTQPSRRVRH